MHLMNDPLWGFQFNIPRLNLEARIFGVRYEEADRC